MSRNDKIEQELRGEGTPDTLTNMVSNLIVFMSSLLRIIYYLIIICYVTSMATGIS